MRYGYSERGNMFDAYAQWETNGIIIALWRNLDSALTVLLVLPGSSGQLTAGCAYERKSGTQ